MDVIRPEKLGIFNGTIYRVNPTNLPDMRLGEPEEKKPDRFGSSFGDHLTECPANFGEELKALIECPPVLLKYVIGKGGETKREIERETCTRIIIPDRQFDPIAVLGLSSEQALQSACTRIQLIIQRGRQKEPFTHFLSIPVASPEIQNMFAEFKSSVLQMCYGSEAIDEALFQNTAKLHLTIGTCVLLSKSEINAAIRLLQQLERELQVIVSGASMEVALSGLEIMNDDPSCVDVLYAKIDSSSSCILQTVVDTIYDRFVSEGLMEKSFERESGVKMHVTLMNSKFRSERVSYSAPPTNTNPDRATFDAREILANLQGFQFGLFHAHRVHLSQRYTTDPNTAYYSHSAIISLASPHT